MQNKKLVLDSRYRTNPEDQDGSVYKFKLTNNIKMNGIVKLELFIFQNSQYVFSEEKMTNKFIIDNITVTFEGRFDNIDSFVKRFNEVMQTYGTNVVMKYTTHLYEIRLQHLQGNNFKLEEYYDKGNFLSLLGFNKTNQGANVYTNVNVPKLFSQNLIYITIPEIGSHSIHTKGSRPFTFLVLGQAGFEVVSNINSTFSNEFYVKDKELDELTIKISDADRLPFVNNKGNANFIIVLSI